MSSTLFNRARRLFGCLCGGHKVQGVGSSVAPKIWAHRGGRRWQSNPPENSLRAFELAVNAGVYGIELDVHRCKSGALAVIHGGVLGDIAETTDGHGLVRDLTWGALKSVHLKAPGGAVTTDEIPFLPEVFSAIGGRCVLNLELKNAPWQYPGFAEELVQMIHSFKLRDSVVLSSFDHGILKEIHDLDPLVELGILIDGLLVDIGRYSRKVGSKHWHPYLGELRTDYVTEARAAGIKVNVWTCNSREEWDLALHLGVDSIVTDDPVGLAAYLAERFPEKKG